MSEDIEKLSTDKLGVKLLEIMTELAGLTSRYANRDRVLDLAADTFVGLDVLCRRLGRSDHGFRDKQVKAREREEDDEESEVERAPMVVNDVLPVKPPKPSKAMVEFHAMLEAQPSFARLEMLNEFVWKQQQRVLVASILLVWGPRTDAWLMFKMWIAMTRAHAQHLLQQVISATDVSTLLNEGTRCAGVSLREMHIYERLVKRSGAKAPICPDGGKKTLTTRNKNRKAARNNKNRKGKTKAKTTQKGATKKP